MQREWRRHQLREKMRRAKELAISAADRLRSALAMLDDELAELEERPHEPPSNPNPTDELE